MEIKELQKKSVQDLHKLLAEKRDELRALRFKVANKQLKDIRDIRETRKAIAQILTVLNNHKQQ